MKKITIYLDKDTESQLEQFKTRYALRSNNAAINTVLDTVLKLDSKTKDAIKNWQNNNAVPNFEMALQAVLNEFFGFAQDKPSSPITYLDEADIKKLVASAVTKAKEEIYSVLGITAPDTVEITVKQKDNDSNTSENTVKNTVLDTVETIDLLSNNPANTVKDTAESTVKLEDSEGNTYSNTVKDTVESTAQNSKQLSILDAATTTQTILPEQSPIDTEETGKDIVVSGDADGGSGNGELEPAAEPDRTYEAAIKRIKELRTAKKNDTEIARILTKEGYRTKTGKGSKWNNTQVTREPKD